MHIEAHLASDRTGPSVRVELIDADGQGYARQLEPFEPIITLSISQSVVKRIGRLLSSFSRYLCNRHQVPTTLPINYVDFNVYCSYLMSCYLKSQIDCFQSYCRYVPIAGESYGPKGRM